jgi:hypothetical protein
VNCYYFRRRRKLPGRIVCIEYVASADALDTSVWKLVTYSEYG